MPRRFLTDISAIQLTRLGTALNFVETLYGLDRPIDEARFGSAPQELRIRGLDGRAVYCLRRRQRGAIWRCGQARWGLDNERAAIAPLLLRRNMKWLSVPPAAITIPRRAPMITARRSRVQSAARR